MPFPPDLQIAQTASLKPLGDVAAAMGIGTHLLEAYGENVAKIKLSAIDELAHRPKAKYVVVSAVTPTPLGEGKTTTTVGLGQALCGIGRQATVAIRQPSMGPTFGIKGGAAGGGYSQVVPMDVLNLHLTGDFHAVTAAHNLLSAVLDNHLYQGNPSGIDPHDITWRRVLDVNDRALRNVIVGLGSKMDGIPRQTGFDITAASEVMAIFALARSLQEMRERFGRIVVGYTKSRTPVTAEDIGGAGAMAVIMRDALKPNLMQTLENTPVLVHAGPFGNIAHGNSSVVADLIGIHGGDFLVTEAGFGADMGAERFFNIKCRASGLTPDAAVVVATVRALKAHSGRHKIVAGRPLPEALLAENPDEVHIGGANLRKQIENIRLHGVSPIVAINAFPGDHASEQAAIAEIAAGDGRAGRRLHALRRRRPRGPGAGRGGRRGAPTSRSDGLPLPLPGLRDASRRRSRRSRRRSTVPTGWTTTSTASRQLATYEANGYGNLPVCIAKTHLSLSSDASLKGAPTGWRLPVREVRASVGAGFIYPICGDMRTMPGPRRHPRRPPGRHRPGRQHRQPLLSGSARCPRQRHATT